MPQDIIILRQYRGADQYLISARRSKPQGQTLVAGQCVAETPLQKARFGSIQHRPFQASSDLGTVSRTAMNQEMRSVRTQVNRKASRLAPDGALSTI
jgi:hypothetical protein